MITLPVDTSSIQEAAELYAQAGFAVVPLHGMNGDRCSCGNHECGKASGKHPIAKDWQRRASSDLDVVREAFRSHRGNIGIMLGDNYVALDVDGDEGFRSLDTLGELPPTLTSRSGSGGEHRIFQYALRHDPNEVTNRRVMPGLDVKTRAGQIVVAPSIHRSGKRYQWTVSMAPAIIPDSLYDRIRRPVVAPLVSVVSGGDLVARARAYVAKIDPAISGSGGHDQAFTAARAVAGWIVKGVSEPDAWSLLCEYNDRCHPPWSERELKHKFNQALKAHTIPQIEDRPRALSLVRSSAPRAQSDTLGDVEEDAPRTHSPAPLDWRAHLVWETSARGVQRPAKHHENVIVALLYCPDWIGKVRLDTHSQCATVKDPPWHQSNMPALGSVERPWTDADSVRLSSWIRRTMNLDVSVSDCDRAVSVVSESNPYHPVRDWMASLVWDGTPRVNSWLSRYLGVETTEYSILVGRLWLISAVARTFEPGCKADHVLILEGPQGLKKSTALRTLTGAQWFSDTPLDLHSKDAYLSVQGKLIVELAELDTLRKAEATRAKAFFSSQNDFYRPPYGKRNVTAPRCCVFAGTTNASQYLQDSTGNRRFWPVLCKLTDLPGLESDRDQVWAEAVALYQSGAKWHPESESDAMACHVEQEDRAEGDEWESRIATFLDRRGTIPVTVGEILVGALDVAPKDWDRTAQTRVGIVMQRLGWSRHGRRRVYEPPCSNVATSINHF